MLHVELQALTHDDPTPAPFQLHSASRTPNFVSGGSFTVVSPRVPVEPLGPGVTSPAPAPHAANCRSDQDTSPFDFLRDSTGSVGS